MLRHQQVEQHIRQMLRSSEYGAGDRIPSERDLADTLGVNRLTVRRAVNTLIQAGLLEGNGTGGTRVALPKMVRPVEVYRSVGIDRIIAGRGGTASNKLIHFGTVPASAQIAEKLRIAEAEEVIVLRRVWSIDGTAFCIETSHLVAALLPGLAADDLVAGQSLYALLRSRYGLETINTDRTISIAYVSELEARLLDMATGAAALALRLLVETKDGSPIEYMSSVNNPELVAFRTRRSDHEAG